MVESDEKRWLTKATMVVMAELADLMEHGTEHSPEQYPTTLSVTAEHWQQLYLLVCQLQLDLS